MKKYTELIDENNQEVKGWSFENMISYQFFLSKMYLLFSPKTLKGTGEEGRCRRA